MNVPTPSILMSVNSLMFVTGVRILTIFNGGGVAVAPTDQTFPLAPVVKGDRVVE